MTIGARVPTRVMPLVLSDRHSSNTSKHQAHAELKRSWLDKLFGVGDLMFKVKEMPAPGFCLTGIPNPEKVLHLLEDLIRSKV